MSSVAPDRQLMIPTGYDTFRGRVYQVLKRPYFVTGLFSYVMIILLVMLYIAKTPTFKSEFDLVMPGSGASSKVSLNEVGQVVSQTSSPFSAGGFSPRVNYKEMLTSRGVIERASEASRLSVAEFGKPKIKLTEQTSILSINVLGGSPEQAQEKAWALYQAFQFELDVLRADEARERDESIKNVLQQYRESMNVARSKIVDFQQRSLIVSMDQFNQLVSAHSNSKAKLLDARSQAVELDRFVTQLSIDLGVSPKLASDALILQSDAEYKGYLSELDQSSAQLTEYRSRWGARHPKVVAQAVRFDNAKTSLASRSKELIGHTNNELLHNFTLDSNPKRAQLFADLISSFAKGQALKAKEQELERHTLHLSDQLKVFSREVAELDRLQREFDMAEAVFTSAAAKLEANKSDVFASYPVIQMLATPSLNLLPVSPNVMIGIAGGIAGIMFVSFGLIVIWQRTALLNYLLKKS